MSNIVILRPNIRFTVKAATIELYKDKYNKPILKKHSLIVLENRDNDREIIHPINNFIYSHWKSKEYNIMSNQSFMLCKFLNWLYFESDEVIKDLSQITICICSKFLIELTMQGNKKETVNQYEKLLIKLLIYLFEKGILDQITWTQIISLKENSFPGVIYNQKKTSRLIHDFKQELIIPFIKTAFYETPRIALGVYYQVFGGLRSGKIVNIAKENIYNIGAYGEFGQILKLEDNNFRPELNTTSGKGAIKVNREQVIFLYRTLLKKLYKHHIENFKVSDGSTALFVNRDGNAMSGGSYAWYFKKLKEIFLYRLENSDDIKLRTYGNYLRTCKWDTHIGRGLFSNLTAEYTDNILEIAIARGDANLNSALTYVADTKRILEKIQNELDLMYTGDFFK